MPISEKRTPHLSVPFPAPPYIPFLVCGNSGAVPSLHAAQLRVSAEPSVSRGFVAIFSSGDDKSDKLSHGVKAGKSLGLAAGGGGLAWRDGALQDVRLGGTTTFEGDIDLRGHRLLNFDMETPDFDNLEVGNAIRRRGRVR